MTDQPDILHHVIAIARRHGAAPSEVREVVGGVANRGFVLDERLFLRVCRPGFEDDLRKEISVIPVARSVGVLTPAVVEYDDSRSLIAAPFVVMERIHGVEPTEAPTILADQLARLHQLELPDHQHRPARPIDAPQTMEPPGSVEAPGNAGVPSSVELPRSVEVPGIVGVPEDGWGDPWRTIDDLITRGYVDPGLAAWLGDWFRRLAERFDTGDPKVLIHGDVAAHNLLVGHGDELRALIDWGDAAWAPRAMDFAKLPLPQVARLLPTYVERAPAHHSEQELAAAILWFHLFWAISKLPATPWPGQRHWTAPTASRLLALLHFFTHTPPTPWPELT